MREILFRGKRLNNGEWVKGFLVKDTEFYGNPDCHDYIVNHKHPSGCFGSDVYFEVDPATVGQYTGLQDKDGKKIFEGDIVKCEHSFFEMTTKRFEEKKIRKSYGKEVIEVELGGFRCFYWRNYVVSFHDGRIKLQNGSDCHCGVKWSYIYNHKIEVIGNIHDNPELLEGV